MRSAIERAPTALLLVDVINDMDFEGSEALVRQAVPMAHRLAALKQRPISSDLPAVRILRGHHLEEPLSE